MVTSDSEVTGRLRVVVIDDDAELLRGETGEPKEAA